MPEILEICSGCKQSIRGNTTIDVFFKWYRGWKEKGPQNWDNIYLGDGDIKYCHRENKINNQNYKLRYWWKIKF